MGATASLNPEVFSAAKAEYESKKNEGLTDEQLFNHMKVFIENKTKESTAPNAETSHQSSANHAQSDAPPNSVPPAVAPAEVA